MEKLISILLVTFSLNSVFAQQDQQCDRFYHSGTSKTIVRFYNSSNSGSPFEKKQATIWEDIKGSFSDFSELSFDEVDCKVCPRSCFNFPNETLPSYTMVFGNLLMATCVRPVIAMKAKNFIYDYAPKKYKKLKNFTIATTHCDVIYPELVGTEIDQSSFDVSIKHGISFVLYYTKWCHYCRMFYPVWNRFLDSYVGQHLNFYIVDCIAENLFCTSQKAIGFPTLLLYVDGEFIEEYQGSENITEMKTFADFHLNAYELGKAQVKFY
ncbi:thioredoxin domain-containing protein 5-like [Chironomus tepperi]|uniref:thioredoxin domain-containing protein 5-like n=1 Tax=Chironomus tepperi TaxID=113505 RepID=UPI00391F8F93